MKNKRRVKRRKQKGKGLGNFFKGIKAGYQGVSKVGEVKKQYEDAMKKNSAPPLPPKPAALRAAKIEQAANPLSTIDNIKKYRPLGTIDDALKDFAPGFREKIRNKLKSHAIGKHVLSAVDTGIQQGFGYPNNIRFPSTFQHHNITRKPYIKF